MNRNNHVDKYNHEIAIIDDDPQTRELLLEMISSLNYRARTYGSGDEFLAEYTAAPPELAIVDVMMPGISGFEVCKRLKQEYNDQIAVIILTALDDEKNKTRGLKVGCDDFLTKPLKITELTARIRNLLQIVEMKKQLIKREEVSREILFTGEEVEQEQLVSDGKKILIVEDNPQDQSLIKAFLDDENYDLYIASRGEDALDILDKEKIDLILLDYYLPDLTGIELFKKIKSEYKMDDMAVIMVTVNDDIQAKANCIENGIDDYLIKPINHLELKVKIKSLLQSLTSHRELLGDYSRVKKKAVQDSLTGLYNNKFFKLFLQRELEKACRKNRKFSLLMLDLDRFKEYNDSNGHPEGDNVLENVGQIIMKNIRNSDLAARYGGEEFSVILSGNNEDEAYQIAERLRQEIERFHFYGQERLSSGNLTVSIGMAECRPGQSAKKLIEKADRALYSAKEEGRNRVVKASEI